MHYVASIQCFIVFYSPIQGSTLSSLTLYFVPLLTIRTSLFNQSLYMCVHTIFDTLKLIGGGGFLGSIRTTLDSTFGGGLKLFLLTYNN